jgi:hypothetical protein
VQVPAGVRWTVWKDEPGAVRRGKGTVALVVDDDGFVRGSLDGALGALQVCGRLEEGTLRAGVWPLDPRAGPAMSGVLTAEVKAGSMDAALRVSDGDGVVVRASRFRLAKR